MPNSINESRASIRLGMVGVGYVGQVGHLLNYLDLETCEVVAIADLRPDLRQTVQRHHNIPNAYETHHELLEHGDVDAVVAITRPYHVGAIALDCLKAGKHVFTEKPMAVTVSQSELLVEAAETSGVNYAIGYMRRYDEGVLLAKRMLDDLMQSGELGRVTLARFYCYQGEDFCNCPGAVGLGEQRPEGLESWPTAPEWLAPGLRAAYSRFMNIFIHDINLMRYLFGKTPEPRHFNLWPGENGVALFDFGDFPAILECAEIEQDAWTEGVEILFQHGRMTIELPAAFLKNMPAKVTLYRKGHDGQPETLAVGQSWAFQRQAEDFIEDILSHRQPVSSGSDSLEDYRLIERLWQLAAR